MRLAPALAAGLTYLRQPGTVLTAAAAAASLVLVGALAGSGTAPAEAASCGSGQVGTAPRCFPAPPAKAARGKSWTVAYAQEFSGKDYDHTKLSPCFDWAGSLSACNDSFNLGREHYQPSQVKVSGGAAHLVAAPLSPSRKSAGCLHGSCTYKSGMLSTARLPGAEKYQYTFTYGYVEARLKFPATQGFFTAFWMLPADPSYKYRSEIDIAEILGHDPKTLYMNYHYADRRKAYSPNRGARNNGACAAEDYSKDWVTLGLDWQPTYVAWYVDGVRCGQFNGSRKTIESGPMQIILDLMVDHQWQRDWKVPLKDTRLTRELQVDYLRVYQQR